ncbi:MAG: DUF2336 domain-containing protein [Alphaproteobacteria bacterium]
MLKWVFGRRSEESQKAADREQTPSYEDAKRIASEGDVIERAKLAALRMLPPELLYFFATDPAPKVRQAVARNDGTPLQADLLLAKDNLPEIRSDIGLKICRLFPTLSSEQNRRVTLMAHQVLEVLARDQLPAVRALVSENIKSLDNAPRELVLRLARDVDSIVAAPVLEFSPLLTDQDLIDVIKAGIQSDILSAIARRELLSGKVCRAVADTENDLAVSVLLQNQTARLDRDTLLTIIDACAKHPLWHEMLVQRTDLDKSLISRIAGYVGESLVEHIIRADSEVTPEIADQLRAGLDNCKDDNHLADGDKEAEDENAKAAAMYRAGELTGPVLALAASKNEAQFVYHALAHLTGAKPAVIEKALRQKKGPRMAVALAWKTRLGMDFATALQSHVLGVSNANLIGPSGGPGYSDDYPLNASTMIDLLDEIGIR